MLLLEACHLHRRVLVHPVQANEDSWSVTLTCIMLKGEVFLNCWYGGRTAKMLKLRKDFYPQCLSSLAAFPRGVIANNRCISFFVDATRPEGRQPEAKRWKWGLDQSYKQTFQIKGLLQQQITVLHITSNSSGP